MREVMVGNVLRDMKNESPRCLGISLYNPAKGELIGAVAEPDFHDLPVLQDVMLEGYLSAEQAIKARLDEQDRIRDFIVETSKFFMICRRLDNDLLLFLFLRSPVPCIGAPIDLLDHWQEGLVKATFRQERSLSS